MYISFDVDQSGLEIEKAAPYLNFDIHPQVFADGVAWLLFNTKEEMLDYYEQTVGDDGPTESNPYTGRACVYALTCSPAGKLWNENT